MCNKKISSILAVLATAIAIGIPCCVDSARAADSDLIITEILIGGNSADEEYIEIYNPASEDIDLALLPLKLHIITSNGKKDTLKTLSYLSSNSIIKSHDYFLLASSSFKNTHNDIPVDLTYSAALVSNGAAYISTSADKNSEVIDLVHWGTTENWSPPPANPKSNHSLERINNSLNWQESCLGGSPGKTSSTKPCPEDIQNVVDKNVDSESAVATTITAGNVFLNEIFPNPKKGSDGEYIEIANGGNEPTDLFGWKLKDASKSKGYQFKEHIVVNSGEYLAIYRPDSKIALNNSDESVYLYNPKNEIISSVSFDKSRKDSSYNFDGKAWKWSKFLTPGEKNKFDSAPTVKIKKPKKVFKNVPAEFSAKAKDKETKKLKYSWNFGDGKKSSLKKATHKYLDTGKYTVTLSVTDDSQTIEKSFSVNVKKSPQLNIEITKIVPNPAGNDSAGEIIEVKNNSAKKIDLVGWKIATGSGEKMYNHPISDDAGINPNETKAITREFSKFSLNNKSGKVRLVMPDGKVVDEVEYSKAKIAEGEAYAKIDGEWEWLVPDIEEGGISPEEENIDVETMDEKSAETGEVLGVSNENINPIENYVSGFSPENAFVFLTRIGFDLSPAERNFCPMNNSTFSIAYLLASSI